MRTIPWREWRNFHILTLEGHTVDGGFNDPEDWTNAYRAYGLIGLHRITNAIWWTWYSIMKPKAADFKLVSGADIPANYRFDFKVTKDSWDAMPCIIARVEPKTMWNAGNAWFPDKATGRYVDGAAIDWDTYPITEGYSFDPIENCRPFNDPPLYIPYRDVLRSEVVDDPMPPPLLVESEVPCNFAALEACTPAARLELFQNGIQVKIDSVRDAGGPCALGNGEKITLNVFPERLKIKYFNPVVNSFSRYQIPILGGVDLVINGLGFANDFDEVNDLCGIDADTNGEFN